MPNYPKPKKKESQEANFAKSMEELELFEEWKRKILPELQQMLLKGVSAKDIFKKYEAHAAARTVTIALMDLDSSRALSAAKEIQDRSTGKPVESKKIEHAMRDLTDEQLEALLLTEMDEAEDTPDLQ